MLAQFDITEADAAGLDELGGLDLAMARDFARRAQAEEDPNTAANLARTYHRMARSYRQTLAMKLRIKRELSREERPEPPQPRDPVRNRERRDLLRTAGRRIIWTEHEPAERPETEEDDYVGEYFDLLDREIDRQADKPGFGETDADEHVVALCADLDLSLDLARRWRDLPPVPPHAHIDWDALYRNSS
jgi:hypothetical protein